MLTVLEIFQLTKAGETQARTPGQASDYTLRAPHSLDSRTHDRKFYQDFGAPDQPGSQVFCPLPPPPLSPALHLTENTSSCSVYNWLELKSPLMCLLSSIL